MHKFYVIFQVWSALMSILSSALMTLSIAWFDGAGSTPYRRIIQGLSISDILQSFAILTGPLAVPPSKLSLDAANEVASCQVNGFVLQVGGMAVVMYTAFLCVYYLCKLKYRMSDDDFRQRVESKVHRSIVMISLISGIVLSSLDAFHTNSIVYSICNISNVPTGCWRDEQERPEGVGECDETTARRFEIFVYTFIIGFSTVCFAVIFCSTGLLFHHVFLLNKEIEMEAEIASKCIVTPAVASASEHRRSRRLRTKRIRSAPRIRRTTLRGNGGGGGSNGHSHGHGNKVKSNSERYSNRQQETSSSEEAQNLDHVGDHDDSSIDSSIDSHDSNNAGNDNNHNHNHSSLDLDLDLGNETPQDRVLKLSRLYRREIIIQATSYVAVFCLVYFPGMITFTSPNPSDVMILFTMIFYPLGGFLNILVYTRPKVASLRRTHPECSRLRGFWLVMKAGGEIPDDVDLSVSCCQDCCSIPQWLIEPEYDEDYDYNYGNVPGAATNNNNNNHNNHNHHYNHNNHGNRPKQHARRSFAGIQLSRIGL